MGWVSSTQVKMHFVFSLSMDRFGQHKFRFILCPHCHGMGLLNLVEIYFVFLLAVEVFC